MTTHTGTTGKVKLSSNAVGEVREFSVTETMATVEDTVMGDTWRSHKTTLKSWEGSVSCWWDEGDTNGQNVLTIGAEVTLGLYPESDGTGATYLSGTAIVTSVEKKVTLENVVEHNFSFQGTGALTTSTVA